MKMRSCQNIVIMIRRSLDQYNITDLCGGTGNQDRPDSDRYHFSMDKKCPDTGPGVYMRS